MPLQNSQGIFIGFYILKSKIKIFYGDSRNKCIQLKNNKYISFTLQSVSQTRQGTYCGYQIPDKNKPKARKR